jgi:MFS superfamily sulfate permease-like transporter
VVLLAKLLLLLLLVLLLTLTPSWCGSLPRNQGVVAVVFVIAVQINNSSSCSSNSSSGLLAWHPG